MKKQENKKNKKRPEIHKLFYVLFIFVSRAK